MQIIRRHQQLQAQLRRYLHIRHVARVFILEIVVQVLAYFFEDDATARSVGIREERVLRTRGKSCV